jgi:hypothetical protein
MWLAKTLFCISIISHQFDFVKTLIQFSENLSNTTDATIGAGTVYPSCAPDFTPSVSGVLVAGSSL